MRTWRLLVLVVLVSLAVSVVGPTAFALPATVEPDRVPGQIVVGLRSGASLNHSALAAGVEQVDEVAALNVLVLKVPEQAQEAVLKALSHNPNVEFVEPNYIARADIVPNDPYVGTTYNSSHSGAVSQWGWAKISAYQAWDVTRGSAGVKVAVVDTGIDNSHPDLPVVVLQKDFINNDNNAEDDNGHGTHVAGTIGALTNNSVGVAGTNWAVGLMAAKVLNSSGSGSYTAVANGIIWAADNGAKVINLSLGGPASTLLQNAVAYAWNKGAVLACSAGNSGSSAKSYPAAYTQCIAVAATDKNDAKASFSNFGNKWVDVAAPGVAILSTLPNTSVYLNTQYGYYTSYDALNGTSMASPHVAGLAGLVWAKGDCATNTCVRSKIETTADKVAGGTKYWAYGRINAYNAVK
jgi:thermitase